MQNSNRSQSPGCGRFFGTPGMGGSLSVDSAPAAAVIGESRTIDLSWSSLTSGANSDWYLGAVSHTGDVGLMGYTLVNVDNR